MSARRFGAVALLLTGCASSSPPSPSLNPSTVRVVTSRADVRECGEVIAIVKTTTSAI